MRTTLNTGASEFSTTWDVGLCVRDPRYVARLANIDTTNTSSTDFIDKLIEVYDCIENPDHGRDYPL